MVVDLVIWGCFTYRGANFMTKIEGGLDSSLYCEILSEEFLQTLDYYGLKAVDIVFQQGNDPKHTSKLAKKWFEDHKVLVLDWPPYSPDLNPIENIWTFVKQQLCKFETAPKSMHELWERVQRVWNYKITSEYCLKLVESMPERLEAVINAKGGQTKW